MKKATSSNFNDDEELVCPILINSCAFAAMTILRLRRWALCHLRMPLSMTRVMHISSSLQHGGLERIIYNFAARLDRKKYHFSVCALDADGVFGDRIREVGGHVSVLRKRQGIDPRLWPRLYRLAKNS